MAAQTPSVVYVTAPNRATALEIARVLVDERLVACANVWDEVTSVYRWENQVEQEQEAVLWMKTRAHLVDAVVERVRLLHPYECPCIVSWPISAGCAEYLDWIGQETAASPGEEG